MNLLDNLTDDQRGLIVSLPYRVGLWVSHSDETGGEDAQEQELTALRNIIHGFSQQVFGSELLQYVMNGTVTRAADWDGAWAKDLDKVPEECRRALDILHAHFDEKEVTAYSRRLMEIAEAVAVAFREYEGNSIFEQIRVYVSFIVLKIKAGAQSRAPASFDQFLNISLAERKALNALADALSLKYSF